MARQTLLEMCEGTARRSTVDTPDSWMMRDGSQHRQNVIDALNADPEIGPAVDADFHVLIGQTAPAGIAFEYRVELPASATPVGFSLVRASWTASRRNSGG